MEIIWYGNNSTPPPSWQRQKESCQSMGIEGLHYARHIAPQGGQQGPVSLSWLWGSAGEYQGSSQEYLCLSI